jgi:hypothetical protein
MDTNLVFAPRKSGFGKAEIHLRSGRIASSVTLCHSLVVLKYSSLVPRYFLALHPSAKPRPMPMAKLLTSRTPRKSLSQRTSSHDFRPSNLERPENHFVVKQTTVAAAQQVDNLSNSQIIMSHLPAMRK